MKRPEKVTVKAELNYLMWLDIRTEMLRTRQTWQEVIASALEDWRLRNCAIPPEEQKNFSGKV